MVKQDELLAAIDEAFKECEPLEVYTDINHCAECAEANELLKNNSPDSITSIEHTERLWDAFCLSGNQAAKHFMPGLARLTLRNGFLGSDLLRFTSCLAPDLISELSEPQLRSLLGWLQYLLEWDSSDPAYPGDIDIKVIDRRIKRELSAGDE